VAILQSFAADQKRRFNSVGSTASIQLGAIRDGIGSRNGWFVRSIAHRIVSSL